MDREVEMKIRNARKEDLEFLMSTQQEFYYPKGEHKLTREEIKEFKQGIANQFNKKNYPKLIAEIDGERAGFIFLEIKDKSMIINEVFVIKKHRKKGIALMLVKEAIKIAKQRKCKNIEIDCRADNKPAINLYKKAGFKPKVSALHFSRRLR